MWTHDSFIVRFTHIIIYNVFPPSPLTTTTSTITTTTTSTTITTMNSGLTVTRDFEALDMARVLDFDKGSGTVASASAVRDEPLMIGDFEGDGTGDISFPILHVVLRGGFIFCFNEQDVDEGTAGSGQRYTTYESPPVCVIALDHVEVQFPPGGRRVFREHAHTAAQNGYELIILHMPPEDPNNNHTHVEPRPPAFIVTDSLSKRNKWAEAIKVRSKLASTQPTTLRAGYSSATAAATAADDPLSMEHRAEQQRNKLKQQQQQQQQQQTGAKAGAANDGGNDPIRKDEMLTMVPTEEKSKTTKNLLTATSRNRRGTEAKSMEKKIMDLADDADLAAAVVQFGAIEFNEEQWMREYWETHPHYDAAQTCDQMEKWLFDMKKSLKGAVLEQYEYFVQASGEMTTMGREVAALKTRIEKQVDLLKEMKEIDFISPLHVDEKSDKDEVMGRDDDESEAAPGSDMKTKSGSTKENDPFYADDLGEMMNKHRGVHHTPISSSSFLSTNANGNSKDNKEEATPSIEIPDWLDDVDDEIAAIIRECRYNAAIELYMKANTEIADLLDKHERPTAYRLTRSQLDTIRNKKKSLKALGNRMSLRLVESLRRKNEALRQATKRERSDANNATTATAASNLMVPSVSPCALSDDTLYLQLLVKLGRTQDASDAYAARRSLLLLETLQERPISGAGTVDLVIYAAQLSQSFFSCLANSVEGFLDLFLLSGGTNGGSGSGALNPMNSGGGDKSSEDSDSIHSHSLGAVTKNLPPGAVSALVLWCDSELSKFAVAFGGARVLANLSLSPPKGMDVPSGPRVIGTTTDNDHQDNVKDRRTAIEVAAQCIDQALLYASQNLDSVGLPLTPRLAEMIRIRLKGCEHEVSLLLDERWQGLTQEWRNVSMNDDDGGSYSGGQRY